MRLLEAIEKFYRWKGYEVRARTINGYDRSLRYFCIFLKNPEVEDITLDHVLEWFDLIKLMNFDVGTLEKKAVALRKFYEFYNRQIARQVLIHPDDIPLPPKQAKLPRVVTEEEYRKLLGAIPEKSIFPWHLRNRALIMMLWDTGARLGELAGLNVKDIDAVNKKVIIATEKSRGIRPFREIFWTEETNVTLKEWLKTRGKILSGELVATKAKKCQVVETEALFISWKTKTRTIERFKIGGIGDMLRKYSNKAGLELPANAHSFRHHLGHEIVKKGGSIADVANILGHSSFSSSMIYTMMADKELQERYRKLKGE